MEIVTNKQGVAVTSSRMIAQVFGKEHKNVIRDIEKYIEDGDLEISSNLSASFSVQINKYSDTMNRNRSEYVITEDAAMLVVLAYSGRKAVEFRKAFITEFRRMREYLTEREAIMADLDDEREVDVDKWENCRIEGFHGVLEELGL